MGEGGHTPICVCLLCCCIVEKRIKSARTKHSISELFTCMKMTIFQRILCLTLLLACGAGAFVTAPRSFPSRSGEVCWPTSSLDQGVPRPSGIEYRPNSFSLSANKSDKKQTSEAKVSLLEYYKQNPAMLVLAPFIFIFGVDILLNLAVLTKRTFEYFVLGQAPSTEPWW